MYTCIWWPNSIFACLNIPNTTLHVYVHISMYMTFACSCTERGYPQHYHVHIDISVYMYIWPPKSMFVYWEKISPTLPFMYMYMYIWPMFTCSFTERGYPQHYPSCTCTCTYIWPMFACSCTERGYPQHYPLCIFLSLTFMYRFIHVCMNLLMPCHGIKQIWWVLKLFKKPKDKKEILKTHTCTMYHVY